MKLYKHDYKGKYFILADEPEDELAPVDSETIDLDDHADSCLYYGIPMYIGSDPEFTRKCDEAYERAVKKEYGLQMQIFKLSTQIQRALYRVRYNSRGVPYLETTNRRTK